MEVSGLPHTLATSPREKAQVPIAWEARLAPWPLDILEKRKIFLSLLGFEPQTVRLIALSLYWLHYPSSKSWRDCPAIEPGPMWWKLLSNQRKYELFNIKITLQVAPCWYQNCSSIN